MKDLQNTINEVRRFLGNSLQREQLKELYNKLVINGTCKGLKDALFEQFISEETEQEKIDKAYKRGLEAGRKELKEFKKQIKALGIDKGE